ncbi:MAG: hypothetical protein ACYDH9_26850 [Limisphaerales bacterium]
MNARTPTQTPNHTPLPWHAVSREPRHCIYAERETLIAVVERQFPAGAAKANADLFVATPDLLCACALALEVIRRHDAGQTGCTVRAGNVLASYCGEDCLTDPDAIDGIADVLAKAIAKAEGDA